jgi:glycosyltransferase involved in cell wall biosynthesis
MNKPSAAIIVRTVGHARLGQAISSLHRQTYDNLRIVLVLANPDFRPDPTLLDERVEVVSTDRWLPRPQAANRGLDAARADFVGFLDEDDWLAPTHVATLVSALAGKSGGALAYSDTVIVGEPQEVMSRGYWKRRLAKFPVFTIHAALFASSLVAQGCRFDTHLDLMEDWDFWLQCAEKTDFLHVREATAYYDPTTGTSGTGRITNLDYWSSDIAKIQLRGKWIAKYRAIEASSREALTQAEILIASKNLERARVLLIGALQIDPGNPALLNRLSLCLHGLGDPALALKALRRACDVDRNSFRLWLQTALLEHACGKQRAAARTLQVAQNLATSAAAKAKLASATQLIEGS